MKLLMQDMRIPHPIDSTSIKWLTGMRHPSLMPVFHIAFGPARASPLSVKSFSRALARGGEAVEPVSPGLMRPEEDVA
ncbi:hypothetical protein CMUS01_15715 [Colletotrichum musicola]|uniref:Uncharacterized protein n=1 Tax=Colletotrichum musicola TaxID=2175873 RepID=A0A8H6IUM7_9PEZI|nr:hypothetical protein CMUS01_15715 [Colletotrichum musicola]